MPDSGASEDGLSARTALILAALTVLIVRGLVPYGGTILYPFTLFATWVHEMGHGVTGLLVGGTFEKLEIFGDASGLAYGAVESGWREGLRAIGGLLGPPIVGTAILAFARGPKRATIALSILTVAMAISVVLWVRSLAGWIAVPLVAAVVGGVAIRGSGGLRTLSAQFIGVLLALDTVTRIDYLFTGHATIGGVERPSDVSIVADAIGGHYLLWGPLLALVSLALLYVGVRLAWAEPVKLRLPFRIPRRERGA